MDQQTLGAGSPSMTMPSKRDLAKTCHCDSLSIIIQVPEGECPTDSETYNSPSPQKPARQFWNQWPTDIHVGDDEGSQRVKYKTK
eukprot:5705151-Amphidinium_carterae.1